MTRDELTAKLREALIKQVSISHQTDGVRKLYDAAVMMQNNPLSETYRQQMHDLLDVQLDNQSEVCELTRRMVQSEN